MHSVHAICPWSWRLCWYIVTSRSDTQRALHIYNIRSNVLTQSHRYKYGSSWWRGRDPCGVIMSSVMVDHLRMREKKSRMCTKQDPMAYVASENVVKKMKIQLQLHRNRPSWLWNSQCIYVVHGLNSSVGRQRRAVRRDFSNKGLWFALKGDNWIILIYSHW